MLPVLLDQIVREDGSQVEVEEQKKVEVEQMMVEKVVVQVDLTLVVVMVQIVFSIQHQINQQELQNQGLMPLEVVEEEQDMPILL